MSTTIEVESVAEPVDPELEPSSAPEEPQGERQETDASDTDEKPVPVSLAVLASFAAAAAAGWMTAGIFEGFLPRLVGVLGPAIGAGMVAVSYRFRSPSLVQYLILPVLLAAGAMLVLPFASGGSANLPGLVAEAIRDGGLSQPPVTFAPGWRFILLVLTGILATGSASLAISTNKPRLA